MSTIKEKSLKYNLHSWSAQGSLNPKVITKAEGIYFWDEDGNKYYDMSAQLVNSNLGHGNKALIQAIKDQADKMPFMGPGFAVDVRSDAAEAIVKLSGRTPRYSSQMPAQKLTKTPSRSPSSTQEDGRSSQCTDATTVHPPAPECSQASLDTLPTSLVLQATSSMTDLMPIELLSR